MPEEDEPRPHPQVDGGRLDLQIRVIKAFASAEEPSANEDSPEVENATWLSRPHIKALEALKNAIGEVVFSSEDAKDGTLG